MKNVFRPLLLCLFSCLCLLSVWAADLNSYREAYQKNSGEIRLSSQTDFEGLQQQYGKLLEALKADFQKQGELRKTKAALAEMDRFKKEKRLPPEDSEIPEIKALQVNYVKRYSLLEQDMVRRLGARTVQYERDLVSLLKALTQAGKLEEATAVETEQTEAQREIKKLADQLAALKAGATNATGAADLFPAVKPDAKSGLYLVVDLSAGPKAEKYPVTYLADVPKGSWTDEYKTDKLVLRRIEPGKFVMGSPEGELGHGDNETQHEVTLTRGFYIGVFEVTQKQWERVMGDWPSYFSKAGSREARPVESVSYDDIRGASAGAAWPATDDVDATSFMGRLRARTGQTFDLPTEAQWEYTCRAGTTTSLNSGKNVTSAESCPNLSEVGRYKANSGDVAYNIDTRAGTAKAGSYRPNAWGLYDLHGNAWERCLDWKSNYAGAECDPKGAAAASNRVIRGGGWNTVASRCSSAYRCSSTPSDRNNNGGFRVVLAPGQP